MEPQKLLENETKPNNAMISKQDLTLKLVQQIAKRGDYVPQKYLLKNGFQEAIDAPPNIWTNDLLIDLSVLTSSTPSGETELAKFRSALSQWGCILVINHGMETTFLEQIIQQGKQFFKLPINEKHNYAGSSSDTFQGYGNDRVYDDNNPTTASWNDRLFLTLHPLEKRVHRFWPENLRETMERFTHKLRRMNEAIYKAMARSLKLKDEECFLNEQGNEEEIFGKFSIYPPCPKPEQVQGLQQHTDGTTMSVILGEDDVEGLEVLNDGIWYKVPVLKGALFVIIGDLGEAMSNGVFKSAVHRVTTNSKKERISFAAFCHPENANPDIKAVNEFVTANEPPKFTSFTLSEYRKTFSDAYARGVSPLDIFKL